MSRLKVSPRAGGVASSESAGCSDVPGTLPWPATGLPDRAAHPIASRSAARKRPPPAAPSTRESRAPRKQIIAAALAHGVFESPGQPVGRALEHLPGFARPPECLVSLAQEK